MVIAFKKRSENPKDLVFEGWYPYIIPNLKYKRMSRVPGVLSEAVSTYANLILCSYKMAFEFVHINAKYF